MSKQHVLTITKADLEIQTFRSGGPGGQHQNTTDSGVRIIHRASGAVGESRSDRSQHVNKKLAFRRMTEDGRFKAWVAQRVAEARDGETLEQRVDRMMTEYDIRIEAFEDGAWSEIPS